MKRISKILGNTYYEYESRWKEDLIKIKDNTPEISHLPLDKIEKLWDSFSGSRDAGWLVVYEETLEGFHDWLFEEIY